MVMRVQLPDGNIAEFPEGMAQSAIEGVLRQQYKNVQPLVTTGQDIAASALTGLGRGIPETTEFLGAATATLPSAAISAARGQYQGLGNEFRGLMAQAPLTPAINQAFGPAYQPQTEAGRYARAMGAGAATGVIGGGAGVLSGLVGGAGSEAGGDIAATTLGEDYRTLGQATGGVLGGLSTYRYGAAPTARGLAKPSVNVPTADDIRSLANQKYQQAAEAGGVFSPNLSNKFLAEASKGFEAPSPLAAQAAKPSEALKYIEDFRVFADKPMTLADAQYLDEYLGDAIDSFVDPLTGKVSKQGQKLVGVQDTLRRTILDAPESEIVGGRAGVDALAEGRQLWQRQAKLRDIEKIIARAELTQNPAQSLKTGFRNLLTNPNRIRGFSADEKELVRKAAESGRVGDLMQTMGSRLIPVISAATGGGVQGVLGAAAATGLSRSGASGAQMARANRLAESVALGEPVGILQRASGMARNVAGEVGGQVQRDVGILTGLLKPNPKTKVRMP
jgi:hypothetical protein